MPSLCRCACSAAHPCAVLHSQVSHHPPVGAAHAENDHFEYDLVSAPTTRFLGNRIEIFPNGRTRIKLKRSGDVFTLTPPNSMVNNIVIGRTWVDTFGQMSIHGTNGTKVLLDFTPCGWFSYGRFEFSGYVYDKDGVKKLKLSGNRVSFVDMVACDGEGAPLADAAVTRLWSCKPKPEGDYYSFTHFAHALNSSEGIRTPLASDSRRRPDRAALADGNSTLAGSEKYRLEELQRAEKKERERRGDVWTPRWFDHVAAPALLPGEPGTDKVPFWQYNGKYGQLPAASAGDKADIHAKGFNPWQYQQAA